MLKMQVFFFGGRLVCGPDPRGMVLTTMAIAMSSWSFAAYVANDDVSYGSGPKIICCVILTFIVSSIIFFFLFFCVWTEINPMVGVEDATLFSRMGLMF